MRLLLAEDERAISRVVAAILEKSHYSVDAVYDGKEALAYLEAGDYDGAILDIMMPGMDGISVLKSIRADGSRVPVLLLTAKSEVEDKVLGLDSGANDYLTKPFAVQSCWPASGPMTRTATVQVTSRLRLGNVTLDRATFELAAPAGSFRLANREFQMMELLMSQSKAAHPNGALFGKNLGL